VKAGCPVADYYRHDQYQLRDCHVDLGEQPPRIGRIGRIHH
jgi:hypothetical protein